MRSFNLFQWLPKHLHLRALVVSAALSVILLGAMRVLDRPLRTPAAPNGIVSFELAGSMEKADAIMDSWDEHARISAGISLGLDYLFLMVYATALALACTLAAPTAKRLHAAAVAGAFAAMAQYMAAVLDAIENVMLIRLLMGARDATLPAVAAWCATVKFAIVGIGLSYIAVAVCIRLITCRPPNMGDGP